MTDKKFIDLQIVQNTKVDKLYNKIAKKSQLKHQSQFRKFVIFCLEVLWRLEGALRAQQTWKPSSVSV